MSQEKLKILLVGPSQSGKSTVANYLSGRSDVISPTYTPTVGLRILTKTATVVHDYAPDGEECDI